MTLTQVMLEDHVQMYETGYQTKSKKLRTDRLLVLATQLEQEIDKF